jgi:hypothetical protein
VGTDVSGMDPDCGSGSWFGEGCYRSGGNGGGTDPISIYTPPTTVYGDAPPPIDTFPVFFQQGGGTTFYAQATASGGGGGATFSVTKTSVADIAKVSTRRSEALNNITSIFGYDQRIPLQSCFGGFVSQTIENLNPFSPTPQAPTPGQIVTKTYSAYQFQQALQYAAKTPSKTFGTPFLVYPNKSGTFRSILNSATKVGFWDELLGNADLAMFQALISEVETMRSGSCQ